jgi:hypothetical protein
MVDLQREITQREPCDVPQKMGYIEDPMGTARCDVGRSLPDKVLMLDGLSTKTNAFDSYGPETFRYEDPSTVSKALVVDGFVEREPTTTEWRMSAGIVMLIIYPSVPSRMAESSLSTYQRAWIHAPNERIITARVTVNEYQVVQRSAYLHKYSQAIKNDGAISYNNLWQIRVRTNGCDRT